MEINGMLMQNQGATLSAHIQTTLLPFFAGAIVKIEGKKDYELTDSVCFICDCLEHGSQALFDTVQGQAGGKFVELVHFGSKDKTDIKYDLIQSCVFGLGVIAQRSANGQFTQLKETMIILGETCKRDIPAEMDEEEQDSKLNLADNSISALLKIVIFQNDGGAVVTPEMLPTVLGQLPLTTDFEEAQAVNELIFEQLLAQNPILHSAPDLVKALIGRIQEYANTHPDKEEDILGEKATALL